MKIFYIITGLGLGGAEKVTTDLADQMVELGHKVTLFYLIGEAVVLPESPDIDVIFLDLKRNPILSLLKFIKFLKITNPDVVHSHMYHANIFARIARIISYFPKLICTSHSDFEGGRFRMLTYLLTSPLMTISTNVSEYAKDKLVEVGAVNPNKMIVIHNSIDINKFNTNHYFRKNYRAKFNLTDNNICLLAVGRFHPAKDYLTLIKVFYKLYQDNSNLRLFIVGDGILRELIENAIKKYSLQDKVTLLGVRKDIPQLMNMCDLFISTSAWEGFGLVLAEAMACQKPVVASKNSGFTEILGRDSPYLANIGDVNDFYNITKKLLIKNQNDLARIGEKNRKIIVENYASQIIIDKWLKLYTE